MKTSRFVTPFAMACLLTLATSLAQAANADCPTPAMNEPSFSLFFKDILRKLNCSECEGVQTSCDLLRLKEIPEVIILGDHHSADASLPVRKIVLNAAATGKIFLATEIGMSAGLHPWESRGAHLKGIESPVLYAVYETYLLQRSFIDGDPPAELILGEVGPLTALNPIFKKAYEELRKDWRELCPTCITAIDRAAKAYASHPVGKQEPFTLDPSLSRPLLQAMQKEDLRLQVSFLDELHGRILKIVRENYPDRVPAALLQPIRTRAEADQFGLLETGVREKSPAQQLMKTLRDRDFAGNIADSLCEVSPFTRHLIVLVGDSHVKGITQILQGLSGGRVKIRHLRTGVPADLAAFGDMLLTPRSRKPSRLLPDK